MSQSHLPGSVEFPQSETSPKLCPACGGGSAVVVYRLRQIPVHSNVLVDSQTRALSYPRGDLDLAFCRSCGFLFNPLFEPERAEYGPGYEETQGFSATFRRWLGELVEKLTRDHLKPGDLVLEIGCGKGEFLVELCARSGARGLGFDPTLNPARVPQRSGLEFRAERYGKPHAKLAPDLVCCRHTLEHVAMVQDFVAMLSANLVERPTPVFFEVPDVLRELQEGAFWDIYYEHCSYFSAGSLARLFRSQGFTLECLELGYGGQYVLMQARSGRGRSNPSPHLLEADLDALSNAVNHFRDTVGRTIAHWHKFLQGARARKESVVLWGSGSKGVGFLTTLGAQNGIEYVVDINPHKHGKFMAGTGQEILAPESLRSVRPEHVLVMNPVYKAEIERNLQELGVPCQVHVL